MSSKMNVHVCVCVRACERHGSEIRKYIQLTVVSPIQDEKHHQVMPLPVLFHSLARMQELHTDICFLYL